MKTSCRNHSAAFKAKVALAVVLAAVGVFATRTPWPDLLVAAVMASLFLHSALLIIRQSLGELRGLRQTPASEQLHNEA